MTLARDMARRPETETLGLLDPAFVSVHREHMKDEARQLHIDARMIESCIGCRGWRSCYGECRVSMPYGSDCGVGKVSG